MTRLGTWIAAASFAAAIAAPALALTPTEIVNRHAAFGGKADVDGMMGDYADDAVVLQAGRAIQGKPAIRALFERMFPARPAAAAAVTPPATAAAPPRRPGGGMNVTRVWEEGDVGFVTWTAGPVNATEEFLVRDGKIKVQAIFMSGAPPRPAS